VTEETQLGIDYRPKVLIVEDDVGNRRALHEALANPRYAIDEAVSGEEALRMLLVDDYAVVLLDVQLPGMDGFDTAAWIRKRRRSSKTPIIFLTGAHFDRSHMFKGYEVGAVDYILKPVLPEILRSKVAVFVDLHDKNVQIEAQNEALRVWAQRSERRFYDLVQGLDAIVWEGRPDHRFSFVSQRAEDILGYPPEAWLSRAGFRASLIEPEDRDRVLQAYERAARDGESVVLEFRVRRADGRAGWMRDHVHVAEEAEGVQLRGVMVDVTAHKENERRLREQAEELAVADRNRNQFLAMLGHELRNPLAPVQTAVELLRLEGAGQGGRIGWGVDIIGRQVEHITRLVDDLLDVARITRGKIELCKQRLDLNEIVMRGLETATPLIERKCHELITALPSEPIYVEADPARLAQVISNLIHNAAKYTNDGGRLQVRVERDGTAALVCVEDNGIGISEDMLARVFELFTQAPGVSEFSGGGLGVGLTLVRSLVELHGGRIEARSAGLDRGSEFRVYLPVSVADGEVLPDLVPENASKAAAARRRILVVDDNADAAHSLGQLLEALGHQVTTVADGMGALDAVRAFKPNVVFLDIGLPEMDGYEVARRMSADPEMRPARLVALTGFGRQHAQGRAEGLFDHFLLKPADRRSIEGILNAL